MKLFVTQFGPASYSLISLGSKYSPRHPVLKRRLPLVSDTKLHAHTHVAGMEYIVVSIYTGTLSELKSVPATCIPFLPPTPFYNNLL
jgi:hypothetical protein